MVRRNNWQSMLIGGAGLCLQFGALIYYLIEVEFDYIPKGALRNTLIILAVGTGLMCWGLAINARGKWQSAHLGWLGLLSVVGAVIVACREDRHAQAMRREALSGSVSDLPGESTTGYFCIQCNYQLNGIASGQCPECGRPFDPDDPMTVTADAPGLNQAPWQGRWSLICGIGAIVLSLAIFCGPILSLSGVALGHVAMSRIKRGHLPGFGVALAGLIISYFALLLTGAGFFVLFIS